MALTYYLKISGITDPQNPGNVITLDHVSLSELEVSDFVLL